MQLSVGLETELEPEPDRPWNRSSGLGMALNLALNLKMSRLMNFFMSSLDPAEQLWHQSASGNPAHSFSPGAAAHRRPLRFRSWTGFGEAGAVLVLLIGSSLAVSPVLAQDTSAASSSQAQAAPDAGSGKVVEDIVAQVNDRIITQSDYNRAEQQLQAEDEQQGLPAMEADVRKKDLLRDLIDQQLLLSKGKDLGITGDTELIKRLDDIRKQNHLDSMEALEKAAQAQGVSYEDFKANIRNGIITQKVVQQEVAQHVSISQADVRNYYRQHQSDFYHPESVTLQEILIGTPADASAAQIAAAESKANDVEAQLKAGAKFTDLAKTDSSGPTAAEGGDLGQFTRGKLGSKELEDATFSLQAGQFTAPIRTKQGYLILKVTEHTQAGELSYEKALPQVEQALYVERMQPALRAYLTKLRDGAAIFIKPGYVDSGASPNEIQITNSAYVPPGPKKKKKFARTRFRGRTHKPKAEVQAAASAPVSPAASKPGKQARKEEAATQKPGKREKIRFGQAPRESLPPASEDAGSQTAAAVSPETGSAAPAADAGAIGGEAPSEKPHKTRFSDRAKIRKPKKTKAERVKEANAAYQAPAAPAQETETEKVQDAPLGLAGTPSKKKKKGPKTRLSDKKTPPQPVQQPYMGQSLPELKQPAAQPQNSGSAQQPAPAPPAGSQQ